MTPSLDIFLTALPGLEPQLQAEARALGFDGAAVTPGGVALGGDWEAVMRANLHLRTASRVLVRLAAFRALHLAQLDKRARRVDWAALLRPDVPVRIDASCRKSRIYHAGAAAQRVGDAITAATGAPVQSGEGQAGAALRVLVRIEDDLCTLSLDTSGAPLHRRGHKRAIGKAPLRETMAAAFLRACGYDGREPVLDPMCGSGSFVIEAAEIAAGLAPGRSRRFAFEALAGVDRARWAALRAALPPAAPPAQRFFGADRDAGVTRQAQANAEAAGVAAWARFTTAPVSALARPEGPPGLVMVNPPYGARIGKRHMLHAVYGALGRVLAERFAGWRVGLVSSDAGLAASTALPFGAPGPWVPHGPLKVRLWQTGPLR